MLNILRNLRNFASVIAEITFLLIFSWFASEEVEEDEAFIPYLKLGYWEGVEELPVTTYEGDREAAYIELIQLGWSKSEASELLEAYMEEKRKMEFFEKHQLPFIEAGYDYDCIPEFPF